VRVYLSLFLLQALLCAQAAESPRFDAGLTLYKATDCDGALREWETSEKSAEPALERPFYQGVCLAKQGKWNLAADRLAPYTESHRGDARGWHWLAKAELYRKNFAEAHAAIERAIGLDNKSAEAYRTLGEIELELKNNDAAYHAWLTANKLEPKDARTTYYLGRLFFEAEFFNEAAAWFRETLQSAPTDFAAMTYLAMCGERLNFQDTSIELYRAAIGISKQQHKPYPWAFLSLAKLLRQLGRDQEALAFLEEAERICPEPNILTALGQMLAGADQPARAEAALRRAIQMDASIPDAHYRLALLLQADGRTTESRAEMQEFHRSKATQEQNKNKIQALRKN
jgi:tetratricopeptide (TPR) repeat protein